MHRIHRRPPRRTRAAIGAAALLLAGLAPSTLLAHPADKPFRATIEVTETLSPPAAGRCQLPAAAPGGQVVLGTATGLGTALHIGQVSLEATDCVTTVLVQDPMGNWIALPVAFQEGQLKLVARNGDEVWAAYGGSVQPQADGSLQLSGQYVVQGGTGRFDGATGTGTLTGTFTPNPSTGQINGFYEAAGKIRYDPGRGDGHGGHGGHGGHHKPKGHR